MGVGIPLRLYIIKDNKVRSLKQIMKKDLFIENEKASLIQDLINDDDLLILVIRKKFQI